MISEEHIRLWLHEVKDPEIPVLSLIDLGVITSITWDGQQAIVEMTPTFVGCPAIEVMKEEIKICLQNHGINHCDVSINFKTAWSSDLLSEAGKIALKKFGLSPPSSQQLFHDLNILEAVCPHCNHADTSLKNLFGPTLCRAIYYCNHCQETFEQFKVV